MEIYGKKACVLKREDSQSPDPHGQTIYRFYVPFWLNWNRIPGRTRSGASRLDPAPATAPAATAFA